MASPITSVPDPAKGGSTSADPLAGVITQVSPRQATAPVRGGPARPTKVAKQGTAKAANAEKKKKKKQSVGANEGETGEEEARKSLEGVVGSTGGGEASASHSQDPSSTLVGTATTHASTMVTGESGEGLSKDKPADANMTPTEPDPTTDTTAGKGATSQQDMTEAAEKLSKPSPSSNKGTSKASGPAKEKIEMTEKGSKKGQGGALGKKQGKKPSLVAKVVAFLTCSSAASGMVAAEGVEDGEGTSRKKQTANGRALKGEGKTGSKAKALPAAQRQSLDKSAMTTPGGGTKLPKEETGDVMSGAVVPPGSSFVAQDGEQGGKRGAAVGGVAAHKHESDDDDDEEDDEEGWMGDEQMQEDDDQTEEQRLIMQGGAGIPKDEDGNPRPLLEPIGAEDRGRKCLVLDLDETLLHSSFKMVSNADFIVPVEIEETVHNVYVIKRPGVDEFMRRMGEIYEVVVFTASLSKYADPVLDILDIHQVVRHRLFRESCYNHKGNYVKDLSQLGREIETSIIIDNSPASYIFHPNNAVPISSWFNDPHDTELTDLCPFLAELADVDDVRAVLDGGL